MKAGQKIKLDMGWEGKYSDWQVFTVEEYRHCLGIFESDAHREAGKFTPLCDLYEAGPESDRSYISNFGEYITNKVPAWILCTDEAE